MAAGHELLARPVQFMAGATPLTGGRITLKKDGNGKVDYAQRFSGEGLALEVTGVLDYDGFYQFQVTMLPRQPATTVDSLHLEIPLQAQHAILVETPHDWAGLPDDKGTGLLGTNQGRLWDSKTYTYHPDARKGNMPPYVWLGDDERGITFSCASDEGMHNDDAKPAMEVDREGDVVAMRVALVNKAFTLQEKTTLF
jgi:hypothetical protein